MLTIKLFSKGKEDFLNIVRKGFFFIFVGNITNKCIGFLTIVCLVHILSKEDFGSWSYAQSIFGFMLMFTGFGASAGILQYCSRSKEHEKRLSFLRYGLSYGTKCNFIIFVLLVILSIFARFPIPKANVILLGLAFLPFLKLLFDALSLYFRSELQNKKFAGLSVFQAFCLFLFSVAGAYLYGIKGIIFGRYLAFGAGILFGIHLVDCVYKSLKVNRVTLCEKERQDFRRFSFTAMLTNSISSMLYMIDTFLVGTIVGDVAVVAAYKTATLIPFNLNFIPMSIMTFVYPYFARKQDNIEWIKEKFFKLTKYIVVLNGFISLFLFLGAPLIIKIFFGPDYMDAVLPFRILSVGYFIAGTFRIPLGNALVALGKIRFNFINAIISGIANIVLDIVLIIFYGSTGAALATVLVFIISSVVSIGFFKLVLVNSQH